MSAFFAALTIYLSWNMQKNQELLAQAVLSLERAYDALSNNGQNTKPAIADRLNWLTCARHIESYKSLKAQIDTRLHKSICNEHEEYWRHQFYLCLDIPNIVSAAYYEEQIAPKQKLGIEPKSALIIYAFASWPNGKEDPMDVADSEKLLSEYKPLQGNIGLRTYLNKFKEYQDL